MRKLGFKMFLLFMFALVILCAGPFELARELKNALHNWWPWARIEWASLKQYNRNGSIKNVEDSW